MGTIKVVTNQKTETSTSTPAAALVMKLPETDVAMPQRSAGAEHTKQKKTDLSIRARYLKRVTVPVRGLEVQE